LVTIDTAQISNALRHAGLPILNCHGGVGGLSAKLVWCVESFFEGLANCYFEASGSWSNF